MAVIRMIQKNFVDMENMIELLQIGHDVCDVPDAQAMFIRQGDVEFKDVCFGYKE